MAARELHVVIDTGVLLFAAPESPGAEIRDLSFKGEIVLCVSAPLLREYARVMARQLIPELRSALKSIADSAGPNAPTWRDMKGKGLTWQHAKKARWTWDDMKKPWPQIEELLLNRMLALAGESVSADLTASHSSGDSSLLSTVDAVIQDGPYRAILDHLHDGQITRLVEVQEREWSGVSDKKDHMLLDCAVDSRADYLITDDKELLDLRTAGRAQILPPQAALPEITGTA